MGFGITGFGLSGGSTYEDEACNLRMYSALLLSMGQKTAAAAVLCYDARVYNSFAVAGVPCPIVPRGYATVNHQPVAARSIPVNGHVQVLGEAPESYEHQEARAAARRLQDEYRRNGALR